MGLLKLFSGKSPEELEQKADSYVKNGLYGPAKIEYEKALSKLEKKTNANPNHKTLLQKKLMETKENLAREHKQHGEELMTSGSYRDAEELLHLALELTENSDLKADIETLLQSISQRDVEGDFESEMTSYDPDPDSDSDDDDVAEPVYLGSDDEDLMALVTTLPEEEQAVYLSYGDMFTAGFLALNQGDFEIAVQKLSQAMEAYPSGESYISLELATAHMNIGNLEEARSLLDEFLKHHPESVKSYQLMCEILWENNEYDEATRLLLSCPDSVRDTLPISLLKGETLFASGKQKETADYYEKLMETQGWDDVIARMLAKAYEAMGQNKDARELYGKIMNGCVGCGRSIDPFIKQRYADTSLETGDLSTKVLELYFDLVREDPENRTYYYQKISFIYAKQGNEKESRRYLSFAKKNL